jgi:hypothetical protein
MIENVHVSKVSQTITVYLTLCNWKQLNYSEDEPELISSSLIFENVSEFKIEPKDPHFDSDEIIQTETIEENDIEKLKIVAYDGKNTKIMNIAAKKVNLVFRQS